MRIRNIFRNITGISTPAFGIQWEIDQSERELIRRFILYLEDRRVLYNRFDNERANFVFESIQDLRERLLELSQSLDEKSVLLTTVRSMQNECRRFLDETSGLIKPTFELEQTFGSFPGGEDIRSWERYVAIINFYTCLGYFRRGFGSSVAEICKNLDIKTPLLDHFASQVAENNKLMKVANQPVQQTGRGEPPQH